MSGERRFPVLRGFVETLPKKGSDLELITRKQKRVHPILASWRYKKGKVAAYTSDANGRWSVPWLRWRGVVNFWTDLLESVKPKEGEKATEVDFDLRYSVSGKELSFDLAVFDQALTTKAAPRIQASIEQPGGERATVVFQPVAKGRFKGILKGSRPGDYKINISYGATKLPALGLTLSGDSFGEQSGQGLNALNLSELAYATGGVMNPSAERLKGIKRITEESKRLYGYPLALAFFLLILEAIIRELGPALFRRRKISKLQATASYGPRKKAA